MIARTILALAIGIAGCGDDGTPPGGDDAGPRPDGGGGGDDAGPPEMRALTVSVPVASAVTDIVLVAGEAQQFLIHEDVPTELGTIVSARIDMEASLPALQIMRTDGMSTPEPTVDVSLRIVAGDQGMAACDSADVAGPVRITGDESFTPQSAEPPTVSASEATLAALNSGEVTACIEATASVDAVVNMESLELELGLRIECDEPPQDLSGTWEGTYVCEPVPPFECGDSGGPIELTIYQSGVTGAYLDDAGAFYLGTVCGDVFRFTGGGPGYTERGVFTRTGPDTATKSSDWEDVEGPCGGHCEDVLTRR